MARNVPLGQELFERSKNLLTTDPQEAEALLRQALDADLYHGSAHNNLGVLLMHQGRLYEAAVEFEWARKLLPGHPDPRTNLGLALFSAGKTVDALRAIETALEIEAENLAAVQALAYMQIDSGNITEKTPDYLALIAMRTSEASWRDWALTHQLKLSASRP